MSVFSSLLNLESSSYKEDNTILNELQVNGQTVGDDDDFDMADTDDNEGADANQAEAPADVADNAAEETTDQNDTNDAATDDEEDDFTLENDDTDIEDAVTKTIGCYSYHEEYVFDGILVKRDNKDINETLRLFQTEHPKCKIIGVSAAPADTCGYFVTITYELNL